MTAKRRLFVATGIFHPEAGGPATYLYELLPQLQRQGWQVRLLTYGSAGGDSYPYPVQRVARRALPLRLAEYAANALPHLCWANLVYLHTLGLPLVGGSAPRVLKIVGDQAWERAIRRNWIAPNEDIDAFQPQRYGWKVTLQKAVRSREAQTMDAIIVPSHYLADMVAGWGVDPARIRVIYNALPPDHDHAVSDLSQADARAQLGLDERPTLLAAARLHPWKGVDHLITILSRMQDVRLLVAGDGEMKALLEQLAASLDLGDRVVFLGRIAREKLSLYMKAADYFALYSGYEGLSHSILESLRAGTPVIASRKGGNPEIIRHGENGLLVPYIDLEALHDALKTAFQPGIRAALAAKAQSGMERFDFKTMVEQTAAVLAEVADR